MFRELPKRPTGLEFTKDSQTILVSDKFGDVFSYPFHHVPTQSKPVQDEFSSHENPSDGQLVLGHASPLTAFLLSHDQRYIITADRDEHIRVSWYPHGYNIETYCLGHRRYVPFSPIERTHIKRCIWVPDMFQQYISPRSPRQYLSRAVEIQV